MNYYKLLQMKTVCKQWKEVCNAKCKELLPKLFNQNWIDWVYSLVPHYISKNHIYNGDSIRLYYYIFNVPFYV